jgi:superfamily II DNA helicase RecQ
MLHDDGTSHERPVREALVQLSMCGRLEGIVVEDAHVAVEWGNSFRRA